MSATIGIGHIITAGTMMWIHAWRIGQLDQWLDSAREEIEGDEEELDEELADENLEQDGDEAADVEILDKDLDIPDPITEDDFFDLD